MTKESTCTIYHCLEESFWTRRYCQKCQTLFTSQNYQTQNYQLHFQSILKPNLNSRKNGNCLEVIVQLSHKSCCSGCINYLQDLKKTPNP